VSNFKSAAQRYRPQRWSEVLDQPVTVRILQNAVKLNRIPSAFALSGQRGTGKTSIARLIAKSLNCDDLARQISAGEIPDPCDTCASCVNIREGSDSEVLEIDAASHRGIDDAKQINGVAQQEPKKDKWRIIILDECHMLTKEAQNALLALFESPPRAFLPILCTTEIDKVLPTILSRCMRFIVKPIGPANIYGNLQRIFADANQPITEEALSALSRTSQGSLRDVQQVADSLISAAIGIPIDEEFVEQYTGIPTLVIYRRIAGALISAWSEGPSAWFEEIDLLAREGVDFHQLFFTVISNLMRDFRIALVSRGQVEAVVPYLTGIPHQVFEERLNLQHEDLDLMLQSWDDTSKNFYLANTSTTRFNVEFFFLRAWDAKRSQGR
jgi:DNA polymerase III subunit gamma/tau